MQYSRKKTKKEELLELLNSYCIHNKIILGVDSKHMPDKEWIVNCLYHLLPDHEIFTSMGNSQGVHSSLLNKGGPLQFVDPTIAIGLKVKRGFFKRSTEDREGAKG